MTVQEVIDALEKVQDKSKKIIVGDLCNIRMLNIDIESIEEYKSDVTIWIDVDWLWNGR